MPANLSSLLDSLLVLAGLVLVVTGLVMFIRSKTSTGASSVETFGIKLNVTHPSLILVLAGVGLMLAPRLLPEHASKADKPEPPVVAEAPQAQPAAPPTAATAEPTAQPAQPSTPPTAASEPAATAPPPTPAKPAATPAATPPATAVAQPIVPARPAQQPAQPARPKLAAPSAPQKTAPKTAAVPPTPAPAPQPSAPALSSKPALAEAPAATPPVAAKPARPTLAYAALGLPINRSFWSGETPASYTRRMHTTLQQAGRDVLRMDARGLELGQAEFNAWWNESAQHPRSRELCGAAHAPVALLSARVETPTTISSVDSAYWPELKLRLFVCANQRLYRQQKTLAPQNDDAWPFSIELNSEIERFLRTYRSDL